MRVGHNFSWPAKNGLVNGPLDSHRIYVKPGNTLRPEKGSPFERSILVKFIIGRTRPGEVKLTRILDNSLTTPGRVLSRVVSDKHYSFNMSSCNGTVERNRHKITKR